MSLTFSRKPVAPLLALLAICALPATAQPPGDARRGQEHAEAACAECHETGAGQITPPYSKAPSFTDVAKTPGMTSMALSAWFVTSHPTMPNFIIPERAKEDLLAWFAALREASKRKPKT